MNDCPFNQRKESQRLRVKLMELNDDMTFLRLREEMYGSLFPLAITALQHEIDQIEAQLYLKQPNYSTTVDVRPHD